MSNFFSFDSVLLQLASLVGAYNVEIERKNDGLGDYFTASFSTKEYRYPTVAGFEFCSSRVHITWIVKGW